MWLKSNNGDCELCDVFTDGNGTYGEYIGDNKLPPIGVCTTVP